ncbi:MAG: mechanosensitive ion channel [Candidatus Omnitrophica bacterium]|nr:mechanosensitive ion channel [Candidatus Omnitrophota bacterium]
MKFKISILSTIYSLFWIANAHALQGAEGETTTQDANVHHLVEVASEFIVKYSLQAIGGIIVLILGWVVASYMANWVANVIKKKHVDVTVAKFLIGGTKLLIMSFAGIVALSKFGIEIAPLIAGISVAGIGLSFALQGPLSNFASGATLIFTKPFKVGDLIEVVGVAGEVTDMKLSRTDLKTLDGNSIVIPNKHIIGEIVHNSSYFKRIDLKVGVSYSSDIPAVIDLVTQVVKNDPRISTEREPKVGISEFADSSIEIYARAWCKQNEYWDLLFSLNQKVWAEFKSRGIQIPFPQRDVHVYKEENKA